MPVGFLSNDIFVFNASTDIFWLWKWQQSLFFLKSSQTFGLSVLNQTLINTTFGYIKWIKKHKLILKINHLINYIHVEINDYFQ